MKGASRSLGLACAIACILGMLVAASVPLDATAKPRHSCKRAHSKTIKQNKFARVYRVEAGDDTDLYACRRSSGKRVLLQSVTDDGYVTGGSFGNVRLAGSFVAWSYTSEDSSCKADCPPGYTGESAGIEVYNLRRHRKRSVGDSEPDALVLSRSGGVAWSRSTEGSNIIEIHASPRKRDDLLLDKSSSIDPDSLAIEITIISWRNGGVERFARLR